MTDLPQDLWYPLFLKREINARPQRFERFGEHWMVCRLPDGGYLMVADRCPHLGASLSQGKIRNGEIECPFHGFCFNAQGQCTHIPALGSLARIPSRLKLRMIPLQEVQGWIWGWWGESPANPRSIPYFKEVDQDWRWRDIVRDWNVHITRAIENQLDVAHLPFVHRRSIGAGGRTLVVGPYVEADNDAIRVWVFNQKEDGNPPSPLSSLKALAQEKPPSLEYRFPGLWQLHIHAKLRLLVAFVPINSQTTRFYVRACHTLRTPLLGSLYSLVLGLSNRWILAEDERVVSRITPKCSMDANHDHLIAADRAIIDFRRIWRQRIPSLSDGIEP